MNFGTFLSAWEQNTWRGYRTSNFDYMEVIRRKLRADISLFFFWGGGDDRPLERAANITTGRSATMRKRDLWTTCHLEIRMPPKRFLFWKTYTPRIGRIITMPFTPFRKIYVRPLVIYLRYFACSSFGFQSGIFQNIRRARHQPPAAGNQLPEEARRFEKRPVN